MCRYDENIFEVLRRENGVGSYDLTIPRKDLSESVITSFALLLYALAETTDMSYIRWLLSKEEARDMYLETIKLPDFVQTYMGKYKLGGNLDAELTKERTNEEIFKIQGGQGVFQSTRLGSRNVIGVFAPLDGFLLYVDNKLAASYIIEDITTENNPVQACNHLHWLFTCVFHIYGLTVEHKTL